MSSSQFRKMLAVQREREFIQRHNSHDSSQLSETSETGMSSRSGGSSGKTPSEYSLPTPDDEHFQPEIDQFYFGMDTKPSSYTVPMPNTRIKRLSDDSNAGHHSMGSIRPEMLASLTAQYEYKYNQHNPLTGTSQLDDFDEDSEEESSEGGEEFDVDFDDDDLDSPIEIANLVCLAIPKGRPAVVSIQSPRSPTFPTSIHSSYQTTSIESESARYQASISDSPDVSRWSEEEVEDDYLTEDAYNMRQQMLPYRVFNVPAAIPPRRASSRMNSLKKLIRTTTSSQVMNAKEDRMTSPPRYERRDSMASSIHSRVTEPPREFNLGAFITSQPAYRIPSTPSTASIVIPDRSTSRRHSKDLSTLMAPTLTPRDPRRKVAQYPNSRAAVTY